jgi:hypothetical protein
MKTAARIEIVDRATVISAPFRIHPAFIPHAVMIGIILLSSIADMAVIAGGWVGL